MIDFRADRHERGLSQQEMAEQVGVTVDVIRNLEKNGRQPTYENARKVAAFHETTLADLWPLERDAA